MRSGYAPIKQTYYLTPRDRYGKCRMETGCAQNAFLNIQNGLLRTTLNELAQTQQGAKEYYGCMKFITSPMEINC